MSKLGVRLARDMVLKDIDDVLKIYKEEGLATEEVVDFAKDLKGMVNNLAETTMDGKWTGKAYDCTQTFKTCSVCGENAPVAEYCYRCGARLLR